MKPHVRKHLVTCALLAGLGAMAHAQAPAAAPAEPAAQGHRGHHGKFDPAERAARVNQRLADLKQKLQLGAGQEPAWSSFAAAMQPAQRQRPDREAIARMTTPDRIDHLRSLRSQRTAEMDRRGDAAKAFYAQLDPAQKKTFDAETARMFSGGKRMGRHHG